MDRNRGKGVDKPAGERGGADEGRAEEWIRADQRKRMREQGQTRGAD